MEKSAGGVAQLGERVLCKHEVIGSIPFTSTSTVCSAGGKGEERRRLQGVLVKGHSQASPDEGLFGSGF